MRMGKRHMLCGRGAGCSEEIVGNGRVKLPIRQHQVVTQVIGVVEINRVDYTGQFVFRANPHFRKDSISGKRHNVRGNACDDLGLADVVGMLQTGSHVAVWIGDDYVGEGKVDSRRMENRFEGLIDCGGGVSNGDKIFLRRVSHYDFAVVVELGGRAITFQKHAELIRPLQNRFEFIPVNEWHALTAETLKGFDRREGQRVRRGQFVAGGLQDFNGLGLELERRCRSGLV